MPPTPFRSFSLDDFRETRSWSRLAAILEGTGGCYGLYGPRGAGKTWLMLRAITEADRENGLGLWFPCPGEYRASEFLAALSGNLATAVQQRFLRDSTRARVMRWLQFLLGGVVGLPTAIAAGVYLARGLGAGRADHGSLTSVFPGAVWLVVGIAVALLLVLLGAGVVWEGRPSGRLAREATAMGERIRFAASLRLGTEIHLGRNGPLAGSLRRARERALDERPVTVASLVFDFRHLARLISEVLKGPLVIGIDELDKITEPEVVRSLLREIKGIFEIAGVFFLVSVSEEAAGALEMGPLLPEGRNEFNSSFYTVLELPPLEPRETAELLAARGLQRNRQLAQVLCVLGEGNWREIVRLAERATSFPGGASGQHLGDLIMTVCEAETSSLLREITRNVAGAKVDPLADEAKLGAWNAFPPDTFKTESRFIQLSKLAIHECWQPRWHDAAAWQAFHGLWQRLLIRLFIGGRVIVILERFSGTDAATLDTVMTDLRDVVIMAGRSPGVAKFMLADRFGTDLDGPYQRAVCESR
jgi:KAP family P-loop domain